MKKTALLTLLMTPMLAWAQIYKCVDPATGRSNFSDKPCQGQEVGGGVRVRPNTLDTSGSREQIYKDQIQDLQTRMNSMERQAAQPQYGRTQPDIQAERIDSRACEQARRSYDNEAGSIKRDAAAIQAKRSAMYGACGMREPDQTIIVQPIPSKKRYDSEAFDHRPILNPRTGELLTPSGAGYLGTRDGRYYTPAAGGVIDTQTGRFIPTN